MTPRGRAFVAVTALTLAVGVTLSVANAPLRTEAAPRGIISFELAGTAERASAIVASWGPRQREAAAFGLGLDFLFLLLYPVAISLAAGLVADRLAPRSLRAARLGKLLALLVPLAAVLDAIENALLWRTLQLGASTAGTAATASAAVLKFALVALGLVYVAGGWLAAGRTPRPGSPGGRAGGS